MLGGWLGSTGCLRCLPGFTPFPLHHSITHLTRQSFLLDCPPDSLFSIFSASAGLRTSASFSVIPSSLFGLILLPSFPICPLRCSHPPLLTPVGVCQASLSTLAVLGSLGFSQAHRSPSPSSLVVGRGVTSARSGYPQEFPLISADRAGGGSWLGGGSNWKISSAPKHILLLKASMQAL